MATETFQLENERAPRGEFALHPSNPPFEQIGFDEPAVATEQLQFERLIVEISRRLINLPEDDVDAEVGLWLRRLVTFFDVDRSSFAQFTEDGRLLVTHSYAVRGIDHYPNGIANDRLPWIAEQLTAGHAVVLNEIPADLPDHAVAERQYMIASGMRAGIAVPVSVGQRLVCVLSLSSFRSPRIWPENLVTRLRLIGELFASAIARQHLKKQIAQKQLELTHLGRVAVMAELASVVAHELEQPLTAVVGNAQAIRTLLEQAQPDVVEADEALKDVIDAAMSVSEIVKRQRRLLRKSADLQIQPIDLNELVRDVEFFIRAEAKQSGTKVLFELTPGIGETVGDAVQLQQVILNLARNGMQAMREQPREKRTLHIRTTSRHGEVIVSVVDSGPPIADAVLDKMFDPFYTTKASGLGMGLSISNSILESHHGRIWAGRNAGDGLTVQFAIPKVNVQHASNQRHRSDR
jgi:signal transduction histidine kinase